VFAESEVVSLLARNTAKEDIAAAAHQAIAERIGSMVRRVGQREVIAFVGGGALNRALARTVEESLNKKVYIPESPQTIVALGAAIAAFRKEEKFGL
jgi:activator of 2-hydroxyglutaryl-CoA dehydratase